MSIGDGTISVGVEEGSDGGFLAVALDVPGCTATGATADDAVSRLGDALSGWLGFLRAIGDEVPAPDAEIALGVDEWLRTGAAVGSGTSRVCFAHDLTAPDEAEISRAVRRTGELRRRLLARVGKLPDEVAARPLPSGGTVGQALDELAREGWWLLTRLGTSPLGELPTTTLARLDASLALVIHTLAHLSEERRAVHLTLDGEEWTLRKVLRRLLWAEWAMGRVVAAALPAGAGAGR